ncbi:MAG: hypothetical protein IPN53_20065 [Comamonadaceae bacterium]|nr:hypothetical protein [Comamonadaceae bacterium]
MFAVGAVAVLAIGASVASAACPPRAKTVFSCLTAAGKRIEVCDAGQTIDYSFGSPNAKPEIVVRAPRRAATTYQWPGAGRHFSYSVDVPNDNTVYSVYWSADRMGAEPDAKGGVIVSIDGRERGTVRCAHGQDIVQNIEGIDLAPTPP